MEVVPAHLLNRIFKLTYMSNKDNSQPRPTPRPEPQPLPRPKEREVYENEVPDWDRGGTRGGDRVPTIPPKK